MLKIKVWIRRYIPLEIGALISALLIGNVTYRITGGDIVIVAFVTAWAENIAYYGIAVSREILREHKKKRRNNLFTVLTTSLANIFKEFGFAELLDSFFIRPFFMYWSQQIFENLSFAILIGKILADSVFYAVTIVFFEKFIN